MIRGEQRHREERDRLAHSWEDEYCPGAAVSAMHPSSLALDQHLHARQIREARYSPHSHNAFMFIDMEDGLVRDCRSQSLIEAYDGRKGKRSGLR